MGSTARDNRRGMSLVEILVTIFVLVVGLMAVIRVLIPGLQALPRTDLAGKATQAASLAARKAEAGAAVRPDAIVRGVRPAGSPAASGWEIDHTAGMDDVDQISLARSSPINLVPAYPNVVCGELFEAPAPFQTRLVECGPYVPETRRVYFPDPWSQAAAGAEDDGDALSNARTFSVTGSVVTLDTSPALATIPGWVVCYTDIRGADWVDVIGVDPAYVPGQTTFTIPGVVGTIAPYSVTLYEVPNGVLSATADAGRAGAIGFVPLSGPEPGTQLACMYEMVSHVRDGFDNIMVTRRPDSQELVGVAVPDICSFDTYVPFNDTTIDVDGAPWTGRIVKLPVDALDLSAPLDTTGPEAVRVVEKLLGTVGATPDTTQPAPAGDVSGGYVRLNGLTAGMPVRVYYRVPGNWSLERHVAAASYGVVALNPTTSAWEFHSNASAGLKQNWFVAAPDPSDASRTRLTFHGSATGTTLDFWAGGPLVYPAADGHRISVDYRYNAGGGLEQRVTGEMHLVDFSTHAFVLDHPNVLEIDAVRGASYKNRICFDDVQRKRVRVDVDTLAMR